MTPLTFWTTARAAAKTHLAQPGRVRCALVARPHGVIHTYVGPLTPSGRCPRAARPACGTRTRALGVVPLSEVRARRVCARCSARLACGLRPGGAGNQTRDQLRAAYAGVTAFDLAVDAWRAETPADVERVEHLALLLVGFPACKTVPVVSPDGKVTDPLDVHLANARLRLGIVRDPMGPALRAAAEENALMARLNAKQRRGDAWRDREARIARLGFINATARNRPSA